MSKIAYFDCFSGCSGDMILGALLDAGLPMDPLRDGLASLDISGYRLSSEKVTRSSIAATRFKVELDENVRQPSRALQEVLPIIESSLLSERVKKGSCMVFQRLAEVEARVHGLPIDKVHFHEIGAVDSIIDIVGAVLALEMSGIGICYCSPLPMGSGRISTAHGALPVPAPATLQLLAMARAPLVDFPLVSEPGGELVTPTGAVLVTSLAKFSRPDMIVDKVGYGAGSKDFERWPNVLRIWIGEEAVADGEENLILFETNIDDMNPQFYSYLMEKLFTVKAADVWFTPIQMKKNRPAVMLSVLAPVSAEDKVIEIIMRETSTLGIRVRPVSRHTAQREILEFESALGKVRAKVKRFSGDLLDVSPEYDDCRRVALEKNIPLQEVYRIVKTEAYQYLIKFKGKS